MPIMVSDPTPPAVAEQPVGPQPLSDCTFDPDTMGGGCDVETHDHFYACPSVSFATIDSLHAKLQRAEDVVEAGRAVMRDWGDEPDLDDDVTANLRAALAAYDKGEG